MAAAEMDLSWFWPILVYLVGVVAGFLNTLAGGGSLLSLPLLIFLGLPSSVANGTNRLAILLQSVTAVHRFHRQGVNEISFSLWATPSALLGAFLGARIALDLPDAWFNKVLALVMLLVMGWTFFGRQHEANSQVQVLQGLKQKSLVIGSFFFIGLYGGFIQAGVGYLILAVMSLVSGYDLVRANAVKVFVVMCYTAVALATFVWEGRVHWTWGLALAAGTMTGAFLGVRAAVLKGHRWIRNIVAISVSLFALKLLFF